MATTIETIVVIAVIAIVLTGFVISLGVFKRRKGHPGGGDGTEADDIQGTEQ